jgi:hypothetical protein
MKNLVLIAFIVLLTPTTARADAAGEQALAGMTAAYASLRSYQDIGAVLFKIMEWEQETTFATTFVRPSSFKFAWAIQHPFPPLKHLKARSVLWSDASGTFTSSSGFLGESPETRKEDSLALGVAGATGVSAGSANTIATLLMPSLWGPAGFGVAIANIGSPRLVGNELVDDTECDHVVGISSRGEQYDLWIGTKDHLLRKLQRPVAGSPQVELHREIKLNEAVAPKSFSPPSR